MKQASIVFLFENSRDYMTFYADPAYDSLRNIVAFDIHLIENDAQLTESILTYTHDFYCRTIVVIGKGFCNKKIRSVLKKTTLVCDELSQLLSTDKSILYTRLDYQSHLFCVSTLMQVCALSDVLKRYYSLIDRASLTYSAGAIGALLKKKGLSIATGESCSGGLIVKTLTDVSGASAYVRGGVCTYTAATKKHILGVPAEIIERYGIVSEETAANMVRGVCELYGVEIALATTGVAGPGADCDGNPEGRVCIATAVGGTVTTYDYSASMHTSLLDRNAIRMGCTRFALTRLQEQLQVL